MTTTKRLVIFTDAWVPQVNGVVETLHRTIEECVKRNIRVDVIHPGCFKQSLPCPFYKSIRLAIPTKKIIMRRLAFLQPDHIHIATEGPIGLKAAKLLQKRNIPYTTSYHTKFPEYVEMRVPFLNKRCVYSFLYKKIHKDSSKILVTTNSMKKELTENKFDPEKIEVWGRGIDTKKFTWKGYRNAGKRLLYVGRISKEKNLDEMLDTVKLTPYTITIVGDGPDLGRLMKKYSQHKEIVFVGEKRNEELVREYHRSDIFLFPSKSDTFGIVQLEAMACGLPVAAFNVTGPKDVITQNVNGYTSDNLHVSINHCTMIDSKKCSDSVQHLTWESVSDIFINTLEKTNTTNWK